MTTSLKEVTGLMHLWIISHYDYFQYLQCQLFYAYKCPWDLSEGFFESPAFLPLLAPPFSRLSYYHQQCTFWSTTNHTHTVFENHPKILIFLFAKFASCLWNSNFLAFCFCFDLPKFNHSTADFLPKLATFCKQNMGFARNFVKCNFFGDHD